MTTWQNELPGVLMEKRRYTVLRHLEETKPERSLNPDMLLIGCRAAGLQTTSDQMDQVIAWLEASGLVEVERLGALMIVKLTGAGRETAQGHRQVPGILPFGLDV
ncbi:VpaChn25_0724 family phage protein [Roseobacter sp. S98]|uniref:VpaChn25_0724 family phage protein n=1 Tax=Roseobacter algicola (ex Choi et al. 2025) (nom. illeg.) TaxID=3092138 RepID=UPI003F5130C3